MSPLPERLTLEHPFGREMPLTRNLTGIALLICSLSGPASAQDTTTLHQDARILEEKRKASEYFMQAASAAGSERARLLELSAYHLCLLNNLKRHPAGKGCATASADSSATANTTEWALAAEIEGRDRSPSRLPGGAGEHAPRGELLLSPGLLHFTARRGEQSIEQELRGSASRGGDVWLNNGQYGARNQTCDPFCLRWSRGKGAVSDGGGPTARLYVEVSASTKPGRYSQTITVYGDYARFTAPLRLIVDVQ